MQTLNDRINELNTNGLTLTKLKAYLTIDGYTNKEVTSALKELGLTGSKPKTFASEYYNYLAIELRSVEDATDYINGLGEFGETSKNVIAHKSHYLNIRELSESIWVSKGGEVKEETDRDIDIKAAYLLLKRLAKKLDSGNSLTKAEKNRIHPDKVSYLEDAELTAAYNDLSKRA